MNFGQREQSRPTRRYQLDADVGEFFARMSDYYQDFALDDVEHGTDDEPAVVLRLRERGWPPLKEVVAVNQGLFVGFACRYLAHEFLLSVFSDLAQAPARHLINSVNRVELNDERLIFTGDSIDMS